MSLSRVFLTTLWGGEENIPPQDLKKVEQYEKRMEATCQNLEESIDDMDFLRDDVDLNNHMLV